MAALTSRSGRLLVMAALLALAATGAGCGGSETTATSASKAPSSFYTGGIPGDSPRRGGVLEFAMSPTFFGSLDPEAAVVHTPPQIFDQLVELLPDDEAPQPAIATSWTISRDGLTYDFKLRRDVKFSDGHPLTAEDVAYTLRRMTTPANQTGQFIFPDTFESIAVVNPYRVRFVLRKPVAAMLYYLADPALSIFPEHIASRMSVEDWGQRPVGSGAFMVKQYSPGKSLQLVRNPHYWRKGLPYLDGLDYTVVSDANQRALNVRSGQADVAISIPYSQIDQLRDTPGVVMSIQHQYAIDDVFWNTSKKPLSDVKVRQALAYATPTRDIVKAVYHGYAEPANTIMPKLNYWDPSATYYGDDVEKAKRLLAESSVPDGFSVTMNVVGGDPDTGLLATILQDAWAKIGVKVAVRQVEASALQTDVFAGKYEIAAFPTGLFLNDVAAPDNAAGLVYDYSSGTNGLASFLDDPQMTRLYRKAAASQDEALRKRTFRQLQAISQGHAQMLPIAFVPMTYLVSPRVRNFTSLGGGWVRFDRVYLDEG